MKRKSGRFVITLYGDYFRALERSNIVGPALPHLVAEMLTGYPDDLSPALEAFGIVVVVEDDQDQGPEEPC